MALRQTGTTLAIVAAFLAFSCGRAPGPQLPEDNGPASSLQGGISIAAASNLRGVLDELVEEFQRVQPGVTPRVTYGSSGKLYAQIANGAPFDIFLSADTAYPARLVTDGLATKDPLFDYAVGRIAAIASRGTSLNAPLDGLAAFRDPSVGRIAIANPDVAPYGRAAVEAMKYLKVHDADAARLVLGENVAQAAQFVASGNAGVGIIPLSLARDATVASGTVHWEIPSHVHSPLVHSGCILDRASHRERAQDFAAFLMSPEARAAFERRGYEVP